MSTAEAAPKKARVPATHPPFKTMIERAIVALSTGRQKASRQAIQKHIFTNNLTVEDNSANRKHINRALARMATSGAITRKSGTGASGSFRPAPKPVKAAGEKKQTAVKKVVKTPRAGTPKKKKPSTKKSAGALKTKSPAKKATKPVTKKVVKAKSPAKKVAAKRTVVKVAVVKKVAVDSQKKTTAKKFSTKKAPAKN